MVSQAVPDFFALRRIRAGEVDGTDLAKVGVEGSNPFARSNFSMTVRSLRDARGAKDACLHSGEAWGKHGERLAPRRVYTRL